MAGPVPAIPAAKRSLVGFGKAAPVRTYWLHILASRPGGALYVGVTNDLSRRVRQHREQRGEHTARYRITRLVYDETHEDVRLAVQRERKHWPRAWKTNLVAGMNPAWRDLHEGLAQSSRRPTVSGWPGRARP